MFGQTAGTKRVSTETAVRDCHPSASPFDSLALDALDCLRLISSYGADAREVGGSLLPFLSSGNGAERSYAITTLGWIGYEPAIPQIEGAMKSQDWRVVYAAIRSLGWLGDTPAVPEINGVASNHWLPEVRAEARQVSEILSKTGRVNRPSRFSAFFERHQVPFIVDRWLLDEVPSCATAKWQWKDVIFGSAQSDHRRMRLKVGDGEFVGTDGGEWGGELTWRPKKGGPKVIQQENVVGIEPEKDGPIVLFGLSHMGIAFGYALHLTRTNTGEWKTTEMARLPGEADLLSVIGPDLFAAWGANRVTVFSTRTGILGLATCINE